MGHANSAKTNQKNENVGSARPASHEGFFFFLINSGSLQRFCFTLTENKHDLSTNVVVWRRPRGEGAAGFPFRGLGTLKILQDTIRIDRPVEPGTNSNNRFPTVLVHFVDSQFHIRAITFKLS